MAEVKFKRIENSSDINNISIVDGQIIYTKDGKTYIDYENQRVVINGTPETVMSDTSTNAVANSTVKNYVDSNINTLNNKIHNGTILWTNTNPTGEFSAQNITLNSTNYDVYEIYYKVTASSNDVRCSKSIKGFGTQMIMSTDQNPIRRFAQYVNANTLSITSATGSYSSNSTIVPIYVVGYKTGLFGD